MTEAYLSIGSNMGDRLANLQKAIQMLNVPSKIDITAIDQIFRLLSKKKTQHDGSLSVINKESSHESSRDGC